MVLKSRVAVSEETLQKLKELMVRLKLSSKHEVIKFLIDWYERNIAEAMVPTLICPYCSAMTFQNEIQLRKHIVKRHLHDVLMDFKNYG